MVHISVDAQAALYDEVTEAMALHPLERTRAWMGSDARGGPRLVSSSQQTLPQKRRLPAPASSPSDAAGQPEPESGAYWAELTCIAGPRVAAEMQKRLLRYVDDLSMDEIEALAGPGPETTSA